MPDNTKTVITSSLENPVLRVQELAAGYRRGQMTVVDLDFEVGVGEIVGVIGPNGAGKSTALKAVIGLLEARTGEVSLPGAERYAYIPELPALYEELTLWEHLELTAMANGIPEPEFKERAEWLLSKFGLEPYRYHFPGGFSKGMRQKIMIMCAFLTRPALYLVDEPFNGLDPFAVQELMEWMERERERGAGVLLSTHVLDLAQRICSRFLLINRGRIVAGGTLEDLRARADLPGEDLLPVFLKLAGGV